jgi:hypothetical protein
MDTEKACRGRWVREVVRGAVFETRKGWFQDNKKFVTWSGALETD